MQTRPKRLKKRRASDEHHDETEGEELEARRPSEHDDADEVDEEAEHVEQLGGDAMEEMPVPQLSLAPAIIRSRK